MSDPFEGKDIKFKFGDKDVDPSSISKPHHAVVVQPRVPSDADTAEQDSSEKIEDPENSETIRLKHPEDIPGAEHIVSPDWLGRPHFAMPDLRRPENFNSNTGGLLFGGDHRPKKS